MYFSCEKIRNNITSIMDPGGVRAFLIEGTKEAILIDTCCGLGNLKEFVEKITKLPISVLCTHGHMDHAGGTYGFDIVYLNEADWELVKENTTIEKRYMFVNGEVDKPRFSKEQFVPQREEKYEKLEDGKCFDLGDTTLECIAVKGHTWGTMAVLIKEERVLLLGDACNPFTYLFLKGSTDIYTYMNSLKELQKRWNEFDSVWFSHGDVEGPKAIINTVLDVCEDILNQNVDAIPMDFFGEKGFIAKKMGGVNGRVDGKIGNVVYGLQNLNNIDESC